jgi:hypothetical protein
VAGRFGWSAVSTEPMTWTEYALARQLLVEERIGTRIREAQHAEAAQARAASKALSRRR